MAKGTVELALINRPLYMCRVNDVTWRRSHQPGGESS